MRVLLDLRCLETASATRGIGRYARELARALAALAPADWVVEGLSWEGAGSSVGIPDVRYPGPRRGIGFADRWVLPRLFRERRIDLYHATAYALPSGGAPDTALVLTIHDLVADVHPESLSLRHRLAFRRTFRTAGIADRVIAVSDSTRHDLLARYPVEERRAVVVWNGVSLAFRGRAETTRRAESLPTPFLLYVGGLDPLKNVSFLLTVLERLEGDLAKMHLVVAGESGRRASALEREASRRGLHRRVHAVGYLGDERLAEAFREATAFVFPSLYEGFGLPPLEAMAAGCPVISSPLGSLAEVLDGGAILCDPSNSEEWAQAIASLARNPQERNERTRSGHERAAGFTWESTARGTIEVYRAAVDDRIST